MPQGQPKKALALFSKTSDGEAYTAQKELQITSSFLQFQMTGLGTLINVFAIAIGGMLGIIFGRRLTENHQKALISACGLCVIFIGIAGCLEQMFRIKDGVISTSGVLVVVLSYAVGTLLGTVFDLEGKIEKFGEFLKNKAHRNNDNNFVTAFVVSSLTVCIGAMAVVGAVQDGIHNDVSILVAKSILDFVIIFILTASLGIGCAFSAIPVGLFQGSITLLAVFIEPILTAKALEYLSMTRSMLIFCVDINLVFGKKI